jgi:hypothetical protein
MDNCSSHLAREIVDLLSAHKVKIITFPPHSTGIFQMLDLSFFGVFNIDQKRPLERSINACSAGPSDAHVQGM